jgi:hypothetical protein
MGAPAVRMTYSADRMYVADGFDNKAKSFFSTVGLHVVCRSGRRSPWRFFHHIQKNGAEAPFSCHATVWRE